MGKLLLIYPSECSSVAGEARKVASILGTAPAAPTADGSAGDMFHAIEKVIAEFGKARTNIVNLTDAYASGLERVGQQFQESDGAAAELMSVLS